MSDSDLPQDDYEVGYGRPPKHTQFKRGQSGNSKGRPPKSKSVEAMIQKELDEVVTLQEGGRQLRITKRKAIIKQLVNQAVKGNAKPLTRCKRAWMPIGGATGVAGAPPMLS